MTKRAPIQSYPVPEMWHQARRHATDAVTSPQLARHRQAAWERLKKAGIPTVRNEEWKYTSLRSLIDLPWASDQSSSQLTEEEKGRALERAASLAVSPDECRIVLCNGEIIGGAEGQIPAGVSVSFWGGRGRSVLTQDAESVLSRLEELRAAKNVVKRPTQAGAYALDDAGRALAVGGLVIQWEKSSSANRPIHVVHMSSGRAKAPLNLSPFMVSVAMAAGSEGHLVESWASLDAEPAFAQGSADIVCEQGAKLNHARIQSLNGAAIAFNQVNVYQERDAQYACVTVTQGAKLSRTNVDVALCGEGAATQLDGLYLVGSDSLHDHHTSLDHRVPHCESRQLYKGIVGEKGRAVFNGKVFVRRHAQKTAAFQTNKTLLMSEDAEVNTKPELEIDADDVKCSHGAAVGNISAEELFYLRSRGIPKMDAEAMLCTAFSDEVADKAALPGVASRIRELVRNSVSRN